MSTESTENAKPEGEQTEKWGRVLICGGVDWPYLGRKEKKAAAAKTGAASKPDLLEPHILRSLANVPITSIHGNPSSCHFVALDTSGAAWLFGRNQPTACGVAAHAGFVSEQAPKKFTPQMFGAPKDVAFVHATVGRSHTLLVGSNGDVWTAGANGMGQCGQPPCSEVGRFTMIRWPGERDKIVKVGAGINFSILLAESGKVYALGSGEHGQLGNGRTGEHILTSSKTTFDAHSEPVLVKGLDGKKITDVSCGNQHSIAMDEDGLVYVWGYNGYCRLGLGNQQDVLVPKVVPQFAGPNEHLRATIIAAGPTNSIVVDKQQMYYMAGKWKNSGDGSNGSPYSTFKYLQELMGVKVTHACSGGVTHFALAPDYDSENGHGVMAVAFGQNAANGELGFGPEAPKSATKPQRHEALNGIEVLSIAAGQNTTIFLVSPHPVRSPAFSDLPRYPEETNAPDTCIHCNSSDGDPLACDRCDRACHIHCCKPPLDKVPDGEWFCPVCESSPGGLLGFEGEEVGDGIGAGSDGYVAADEDEMDVRNSRKRKGRDFNEGNGKRKKD